MRAFLGARGAALGAGAIAAALGLEIAFLAAAVFGVPFAPLATTQAAVDVTPGQVSTVVIDLLQFWAKRLAQGGILALHLAAGAVAAALGAGGARVAAVAAVAAAPWALAVAAALLFARGLDPVQVAVDATFGLLGFGVALRMLRGALVPAPFSTKRRLLVGAGALAGVAGVAEGWLGSLAAPGVSTAARPLVSARSPVVRVGPFAPEPLFDETEGLSPLITSNRDFYVVDTAFIKPKIDASAWKLRVEGHVERPFEIAYEELTALDAVEQVQTLECISNPVGGELISTAKWTGVRAAQLLERARPLSGAVDLVMVSHDGYSDSVPLAKALEPTTLVAYGMNDETLPVEHGHPARMLIPDIYGMKQVKWVTRLVVSNTDWAGYWQVRGWSDVAIVQVNSRIDVPARVVRWNGRDPVRLAGVAFAGARKISKVEVSTDGGTNWREAQLGRDVNDFTWRRWLYEWVPAGPGEYRVSARCFDATGARQIVSRREPYPDGATGLHVVTVRIERV